MDAKQPTPVEQAKALVAAFQAAHPGKRIALTPDGGTNLVDETEDDRERYRCALQAAEPPAPVTEDKKE